MHLRWLSLGMDKQAISSRALLGMWQLNQLLLILQQMWTTFIGTLRNTYKCLGFCHKIQNSVLFHWHLSYPCSSAVHCAVCTLSITQRGRDNMAAISQTTFLNAFPWIKMYEFCLWVHVECVPKVRMNNIPILVQIVPWCKTGRKPLSETMMVTLRSHICVTLKPLRNTTFYT